LSSGGRLGVLFEVNAPGGVLVVGRAGLEAAVQDADQAVAELAQGGVVAEAAGALLVVVAAGAGEASRAAKACRLSASMSRSLWT
jgi:hypothetical protein